MYEKLTEHFLSMKWDKEYLNKLNTSLTEDTIVSSLDLVFPEWSFKITNLNDTKVAGTLFLPGRLLDGTGSNEWSAIYNIITMLTKNISNDSKVSINSDNVENTVEEKPKTTVNSVLEQLNNINSNIQNNSDNQNDSNNQIFNDLLNNNNSGFVEFDSSKQDDFEKQFLNSLDNFQNSENDPLKTPTPEEVNPNHVLMNNNWTTENGSELKQWMADHNISSKEEISSWLKKYCGLEYDYFNPEWAGKFIAWTKALREKQTY